MSDELHPPIEFKAKDRITGKQYQVRVNFYADGIGIQMPNQRDPDETHIAFDIWHGQARIVLYGPEGRYLESHPWIAKLEDEPDGTARGNGKPSSESKHCVQLAIRVGTHRPF